MNPLLPYASVAFLNSEPDPKPKSALGALGSHGLILNCVYPFTALEIWFIEQRFNQQIHLLLLMGEEGFALVEAIEIDLVRVRCDLG